MNYEGRLNPTVRDIRPSGIRKFFDIVSEMPDAISLGVGEPDFPTPWGIRDYSIKMTQKGYTQYTSNRGLLELRREIAEYLESRFNISYSPETEVLVTVGASEAIDLALRCIVVPGDEVLVPDPAYVSYQPNVQLVGGVCKPVTMKMEDDFRMRADVLEAAITEKSKALILPYPNNPTGAIMGKEDLEKIAEVVRKHDLFVISDEIYGELTYGQDHVSFASLPGMRERTVVVSGFSKAFSMTGWRLGYAAAPKEISDLLFKVHQYTIMCAPSLSQHAGYFALKSGKADGYQSVLDMKKEYDMRRRLLVSEFNKMGLTCFEPKGAFYVFPRVKSTGMGGNEFAEKLLYSKKVAVVPGDAFGESGTDFIRCSYAASMKALETALTRIRDFIGG